MKDLTLRLARIQDAIALLDIYRYYIENTVASFECETPPLSEFSARMQSIAPDYPYILCQSQEGIIGYAYAHRQMERAAYGWNAELSVYIRDGYTGSGLGKRMYSALIDILKLQNIQNAYGCIVLPNEQSVGLHLSLGFQQLGIYHKTGYKFGQWRDVAWFEKPIGSYKKEPKQVIPFSALDHQVVQDILQKWSTSIRLL